MIHRFVREVAIAPLRKLYSSFLFVTQVWVADQSSRSSFMLPNVIYSDRVEIVRVRVLWVWIYTRNTPPKVRDTSRDL